MQTLGPRSSRTCAPANSACGNCCFSEQVSHQRGLIPLTLFKSKPGGLHAAPCADEASLIHDANCGNDDEESISDYGALSHVKRWMVVMQRRWWGWSKSRKYREEATKISSYAHAGHTHSNEIICECLQIVIKTRQKSIQMTLIRWRTHMHIADL